MATAVARNLCFYVMSLNLVDVLTLRAIQELAAKATARGDVASLKSVVRQATRVSGFVVRVSRPADRCVCLHASGLYQQQSARLGSILRSIEHNFGTQEGALNFADARAKSDLTGFVNLHRAQRPFQNISAEKDATFFLNDMRPATDPDDD